MSKKISNVTKSNSWTREEVHKKINWHQLTSILMSHMKVIKSGEKYFLLTFWGFLITYIYVMSKLISICVNLIISLYFFVNLLHSLVVWLFDTWHLPPGKCCGGSRVDWSKGSQGWWGPRSILSFLDGISNWKFSNSNYSALLVDTITINVIELISTSFESNKLIGCINLDF